MGKYIDITLSQTRYETMLLYIIHHSACDEDVAWASKEYWRLQK